MRPLLALLLLLFPAALAAQTPAPAVPSATLEAIRRHFPLDHRAIMTGVEGKSPPEARRAAYAGIDTFLRARRSSIVGGAPATVVALEARQGALLRSLGRLDVKACAVVGDRGFFSPQAADGPTPEGLDAYGAALVEAAAANVGRSALSPPASAADLGAWIARVEAIEPGVPVRRMLSDPAVRAAAGPDHLCRGAAAMHEAAASLPSGPAERVSRMLLGAVIGASAVR
jgi:hypothetical protein